MHTIYMVLSSRLGDWTEVSGLMLAKAEIGL